MGSSGKSDLFHYIRLYFWYLRANWLSLMAYPAAFVSVNLAGIVYAAASLASVWVLFSKIDSMGGWTFPQVMLIYGLSILSRSLFHLFWVNITGVSEMIRQGDIDRLLVTPLNPLFQVIAGYLDNDDWGELATALVLVWTSLGLLGKRTALNLGLTLLFGVSGSLIFASIHIIANSTAFLFVEASGVTQLAWTMDEFSRYPADIYGKGVQVLTTWIVPVAFASFFPAQAIFGGAWQTPLSWITPLIAAATFSVAVNVWNKAVDKYQGVGN